MMPTPISSALAGSTYKGTMGSTAGDISDVIGQFVAQAKADKDKKEQQAMAAALQAKADAFKQQQIDLDRTKFGEDMEQHWQANALDRDKIAATERQTQATAAATEAERLRRDEDRDAALKETTRFHDVLGALGSRRADQGDVRNDLNARRLAFQQDLAEWKKTHPMPGQGYQAVQTENGEYVWLPKPGVNGAPGNPAEPVQPGADTDPQAAHSEPQDIKMKPASPGGTVIHTGVHGSQANAPAGLQTALANNKANQQYIQKAIAAVQTPEGQGAFGLKNLLPDLVMQRVNPAGVAARASVADIGSLKIHDRSGAAVTAKEFPRLKPFIPDVKDEPAVIVTKLQKFAQQLDLINKEIEGQYPNDTQVSDGGSKPAASAPATVAPGGSPKAFWAQKRAEGMSADEATRATLEQFPNAKMKGQ